MKVVAARKCVEEIKKWREEFYTEFVAQSSELFSLIDGTDPFDLDHNDVSDCLSEIQDAVLNRMRGLGFILEDLEDAVGDE